MYNVRKVTEDIVWVGASDRRLALFENIFPIPRGVSYNSYVLLDEKTVLLDTVDASVAGQFFENLEHVLDGRKLDYLIVNHMEPDHCAMIGDLVRRYPEVQVVGNAKTFGMMKQFFGTDFAERAVTVKEGDTLATGAHTLHFVMAPMVHWPEVMVTYDEKDKVLFAADGFGTFGALNGNIFADEVDFDRDWLDDARRYYTNIVGKYGASVQALLKKASGLEIAVICPLHGPIWRENLGYILEKYQKWSTYEAEDQAVVILYATMYGNTASAADALAGRLAAKGVEKIAVYDVSNTHVSELISEIFRASHVVFAAPTYNGGIYPVMENLLADMKALAVQNKTVALMENGTWAPTTAKQMREKLAELKNVTILDTQITIKSAMAPEQEGQLEALADAIVASMDNQ
jgi:flavorubredoxin